MPSWLTIPEQTIKPVVSFLLNRYVGELLLGKVSRDQLNIDLVNGTGSLHEVNLNVQYINDALRKAEVPLELIDGYINSIVVQVPFMKVLEDSCTIEVTGLEITVQPRPYAAMDIVTSMFESMVGSMTTSMDLARSFVEEQGDVHLESDDQQVKGIDALARLIEIVLSRMKVVFHDTIIRIEHFPGAKDGVGIALEIGIETLEFIDEILADVETQKAADPITSQPHSIGVPSSSNVCKIVRLHGVRLSSDIFTKPTDALCKSIYLRSSRKLCETSVSSSVELNRGQESFAASIYQSVNTAFISTPTSAFSSPTTAVLSQPLQFAEFCSDKIFIKIKLKNNAANGAAMGVAPKMENVDVEMFLGSLNVFLTPTQVHLLATLANAMMPDPDKNESNHATSKNKPMQADDFAKVEWDLRQHIDTVRLGGLSGPGPSNVMQNDFQLGNWSGEDTFYTTSKFPKTFPVSQGITASSEFTSIPMSSSDSPGPDLVETMHWKHGDASSLPPNSKKKSGQEKPDTTHCKVLFSSVWITLTHEDLLSTSANSSTTTDILLSTIAKYFQAADRLPLAAGTVLKETRRKCDDAYEKDHLRFVGCPFVLEYTANRNSMPKNSSSGRPSDVIQFQVSSGNCELLECLSAGSIWAPSPAKNDGLTHVELFAFDRNLNDSADKPDFSLKLTRDAHRYSCVVSLRPCRTEFDVTLVDRLCNLIFCQPSFARSVQPQAVHQKYLFEVPPINDLSLRDDLFEPLDIKQAAVELKFELNCPSWIVDLRFPVPDMRSAQAVDRRPWWVREMREDVLRLHFEKVKLSTLFNESFSKQSRFIIEFLRGTGFFKTSHSGEFVKCLYASSRGQNASKQNRESKTCSIEIKWDFVARSLLDERRDGAASSGDSSGSEHSLEKHCFKVQSSLDGPFSKRSVAHENEQLTIVGSREEISEFKRGCLRRCEMGVCVNVPELRLRLPGKELFTVLYNRIANDLTVWTPSGPGFQRSQNDPRMGTAFSVHVAGLGLDDDLFAPCKSMHKLDASLSDSELSDADRTLHAAGGKQSTHNRDAHRFTFLLQCEKLDGVVQMPVKDEASLTGVLKLSAEYGELFVVSGYGGDENTVYFYLTSRAMALWHNVFNADSLASAMDGNSLFDTEQGLFSDPSLNEKFQLHCIAEPTPLCLQLRNEPGDNFSIALRSCVDPKENIKDILLALGFRNSTIHYRMQPPNHYWLMQLIDYFDIPDDPIVGLEPPKTVTELHVHGWCMAAEYRPPQLPYTVRAYIDSLDISSNLVQEAAMFRLHFIFEDSSLFLGSKGAVDVPLTAFVCLMRMGFFELTVTSAEPQEFHDGDAKKPLTKPLLELHARNDVLELRTCADSLAALALVIRHLAEEGAAAHGDNQVVEDIVATGIPPNHHAGINGKILHNPMDEADYEPSDSKLRDMMASAMEDAIVPVPRTNNAAPDRSTLVAQIGDRDGRQTSASLAKVKPPEPVVRLLSHDPVKVVDCYFKAPLRRTDMFASLPPGYPTPLVQYLFRDISLVWHMYGGNDFNDGSLEYKSYSGVQGSRCSPKVNQRFFEARESLYTAGGPQRDHSVCVTLNLNKMCFLHELFPPDHPQVAREIVTVQDIEMHDLLMVSGINKLLYQYTADQTPRQTYVPMVNVKMLHIVSRDGNQEMSQADGECCLKVSVLPMRLNIDQDTLQFLQDFGKECSDLLDGQSSRRPHQRRRRTSSTSIPVTVLNSKQRHVVETVVDDTPTLVPEKKVPERTEKIAKMASVEDLLNDASQDAAEPTSIASSNGTQFYSQPSHSASNDNLLDINRPDSQDEDQLCVELFGPPSFDVEIEAVDDDSGEPEFKIPDVPHPLERRKPDSDPTASILFRNSQTDGRIGRPLVESVRFSKTSLSSSSSSVVEEQEQIRFPTETKRPSSRSSLHSSRDQSSDESSTKGGISERDMMKLFNTPIPTTESGLYFKSFTFSPDLVLRIDYHGKRIQTAQGAVVGLLLGLSQLHCTELRLKELNHRHGLLGFDKVVNYALMEWLRDIRRNQLYNIVGGVGPMHSLVQIALGIRDLFWLPVDQFRKDGHIVKGFQRGAQSFGLSTATATLELGQKFFGAIQFMAEFAFDIVNPDYHRHRSQADILQSFAQPADFREGVTLAVSAFRRGFAEMAQAIVLATQEERASGRWAVRGVLRQATPTALRPVVVFSQATTHVLGGLRNQLRPDTRREEQEKWKNDP